MMKLMNKRSLFFVLISGFLTACTTVPLTGRHQLNLVGEDEMISMSLTQYDQFLTENKVSDSKHDVEMVKRVGKRIAKAVEAYLTEKGLADRIEGFEWEFNLVENESVNAWCMPGGKVVFYTGILPLTEDEAGLAVVMGHEIAHAIARHGNERMSQQMLTQLGGTALSTAVKSKPAETQNIYMLAYGVGTQLGAVLPFSRRHELEADHMGLMFMAMAGYDPNDAVEFWKRMAAASGKKPPEFLSTHPVDEKRIANIELELPEALEYYRKFAE